MINHHGGIGLVIGFAFIASGILKADIAYAEQERITDLATLERVVVGRQLETRSGKVRILVEPHGKLVGFLDNKKITGKWEFRDQQFCRSFRVGTGRGEMECQIMSYDENGVTVIRASGQGTRVKYRFAD
ncbi:MAG: hypothetical protein GKS02_10300 [Alphaproteobacteria bacterium]|nr:hypothetical protein [Alphaproteobacteria bacterium]